MITDSTTVSMISGIVMAFASIATVVIAIIAAVYAKKQHVEMRSDSLFKDVYEYITKTSNDKNALYINEKMVQNLRLINSPEDLARFRERSGPRAIASIHKILNCYQYAGFRFGLFSASDSKMKQKQNRIEKKALEAFLREGRNTVVKIDWIFEKYLIELRKKEDDKEIKNCFKELVREIEKRDSKYVKEMREKLERRYMKNSKTSVINAVPVPATDTIVTLDVETEHS
jgi:hypothetical protein